MNYINVMMRKGVVFLMLVGLATASQSPVYSANSRTGTTSRHFAGSMNVPQKTPAKLMATKALVPASDAASTYEFGSGDAYTPFVPMAPGDGWMPPTGVDTDPNQDNWTPMIAVDANGTLWCSEQVIQSGYYDAIAIYKSTDQGASWQFETYISGSVDLGDPTIAIDVDANKMYVSFWADYFLGFDKDAGWGVFDISGTSLTNFSSGWFETSSPDIAGPTIAFVERGYGVNYALVAWESYNSNTGVYSILVSRTTNQGVSWSSNTTLQSSTNYLGQVWANAGDNRNPCLMITYKEDLNGTDWSACERAHLRYSVNRGASWTDRTRDFGTSAGGYVNQTTSAIAFGSNYVVWAIQVNPSSSDGNIFVRYSTDRCNTWSSEYYLENNAISTDSRMPMVIADGMQQSGYTSQYFYIGFYRETSSGSGTGNYFFNLCAVNNATSASNWSAASDADSFAIANEASYSVKESNWAQLHLTSMIRNGGYVPALVWNHETGSSNHDLYFTRTLDPVYEDVDETGQKASGIVLLNPVNRGVLEFALPQEGRFQLKVFATDGRLVATEELSQRVYLDLGTGVYMWSAGSASGKLVIQK